MKKLCSMLILLIMLIASFIPAFAADWSNYNDENTLTATDNTYSSDVTVPGREAGLLIDDEATKIYNGYIDVMPVVTTDDLLQWAITKGNEIIYLLQVICQPFSIIIFIIASFITLIGAIGKGDLVGKGIFSMIIACVVYAAALYAPVILQTFVGWVAS